MTIISIGKLIKLKEPEILCNVLKLNVISRTSSNRVHVPKFIRNHYQNSFCYLAPVLWNSLDSSKTYSNNVTIAPSINTMKTRLKRFLMNMQNYGSETEWVDYNKIITSYLSAIKADPYYVTTINVNK